MADDREVAGIRCMQVLAKLDDYVADELSTAERDQINAHLRGCDWCTRFGGRYSELVATLRASLLDSEGTSGDEGRRLAKKLLGIATRSKS